MKIAYVTFYIPLTILSLSLSSCRKTTQHLIDNKQSGPAYGDMYVSASIGDASYLNPVLASDSASGAINGLVYNGLIKYDKDIRLVGDLAQSWTVSPDGKVITFYLRKNVRWHDGIPFSAKDVKFTYEKLVDASVKTPYSSDYLLVKELKIIDDYTLRVTYKEPFAPALESWGMGIIPEHIFSKGDFNSHPANRNPVGTGPYKFKEWKTDEKIVLEANTDYFEGKPYISRYIYRIIPDQAVQFLELRHESIDDMGLTPDQWKAYPEFFINYNKFRYSAFTYTYLGFNLKNPLFADKKMRKAIAYGINKLEIIDGVLLGMGKAATGPFPAQSWAYNSKIKDYEYNPEKSKELIASLGWEYLARDGYFYKNGRRLEFNLLSNQGNKMRSLSAEIIQAHLKKIGIKVNIRIIEWSSFVNQFINKKNFDAVILGWGLGRDPDQYSIWHSGQSKEGGYNFISYSNPEVDRLLEEGRREFDRSKRLKIYHRVHELIFDDVPYVFLYYPEALTVVHKRFNGPEAAPLGIGWNFHKWWSPKNEQKYIIQ